MKDALVDIRPWGKFEQFTHNEINGVSKVLKKGEKVFIAKKARHRLSSSENSVRVLEIAWGYFDEKDIIRYEDDFGRDDEKWEKIL